MALPIRRIITVGLLVVPCLALARAAAAGDMTPQERARLDQDALRATRHLELYGRYMGRMRELIRIRDDLRRQQPATPEAQRERDARLRYLEEDLLPAGHERTQELGRLWDERWMWKIGPISRYETTTPVPYLDRDESGAPGLIRERDEDYLRYWIQVHFRLDERPQPPPTPDPPMKGSELPPLPPDVMETPATASEPVTIPGTGKTWDALAPEERSDALGDCIHEAWNVIAAWWYGTDEEQKQEAAEALGDLPPPPEPVAPALTAAEQAVQQAALDAWEAARAESVRRAQAAQDPLARWRAWTVERRHAALLGNDPIAWDAVKALLSSGRPQDVQEVLAALERAPKPGPPPAAPVPMGPENGVLTVYVSRPTEGGGSPFGGDPLTEPVADAVVVCRWTEESGAVESRGTTDADGAVAFEVPLGVPVTVAWGKDAQEVTCTFDRPERTATLGGIDIPSVSTADPEDLPPPPPMEGDDR